MRATEYTNMFHQEDKHFIYVETHKMILNFLERYLPAKKDNTILDAGCGTGLLMTKLDKYGKVFGIDIYPKALDYSKQRALINLKKGSVTKLPYKSSTFDLVLSIDVLYHKRVEDDLKALSEFYRVLKPNGILLLKLPAYDWLRGKHDLIIETKHRYNLKEVKTKLESNKFKIIKISYAQILILPLAIIKRTIDHYILKKTAASDVSKLPAFVNNLFSKLINIENGWLINKNLPAGLTIFAVAQAQKDTHKKIS